MALSAALPLSVRRTLRPRRASTRCSATPETDVIVVGAGYGGLCAGALLARYGLRVTVLESHDVAGGAAHHWKRDGYTFESGPSLFSDLSRRPSGNPLSQVLHALGEELPCVSYNTWLCHLPEGAFLTTVGSDQFTEVLAACAGPAAAQQWHELRRLMAPLSRASVAVPAAAARTDAAALFTLGRFLPGLLAEPAQIPRLLRPFEEVLAGSAVTDPWLLRWLDLLCFLLSGAKAAGTPAAEIGFMFADWYGRPDSGLQFPIGGAGAITDALVRGLTKHGGELRVRSHVTDILVEGDGAGGQRACGVRLRSGQELRAKRAVISNASIWDTLPLLPPGALPAAWAAAEAATEQCPSFMHLHLGISAEGLPPDLECHHISIDDWAAGVDAPQNLVLVSIASVLDPGLAPTGHHVIHAYTPATEPTALWAGVQRGSPEYEALKAERAEVLWRAVEKAIPDVRQRVTCGPFVGTPDTHRRYLRRSNGTYGGTGWLKSAATQLPRADTPLPGLLCVGDSRFPGPGVPAVAAGGWAAAHSLVGPLQQCAVLDVVCPR